MTKNIVDCQTVIADNDELNVFVDNGGLLNKVNIKSLANRLSGLINKGLPSIGTNDEGKFLKIVNGIASWVAIENAEEVSV